MITDLEAIVWNAKDNSGIWKLLIGCSIKHRDQNEYIIKGIEGNEYIKLEKIKIGTTHVYALHNISEYFTELNISDNDKDLLNRFMQFKNKLNKEKALFYLRIKYGKPDIKDNDLSDHIDSIICRIDNGDNLLNDEQKTLSKIGMNKSLAIYFENQINRDPWAIPKASSYWRLAGDPKHALELTANITIEKSNNLKARILTSRGGAFRDLNKHEEAINCALKAVEHDDTGCCPFNLLGAIYLDLDKIEQGRDYFDIAKDKKGYQPIQQLIIIKEKIKNAKDNKDYDKEKRITQYFKNYLSGTHRGKLEYDDILF